MGVSKGEAVSDIVVHASELAARPAPAPRVDITIRPAVMEDVPFLDALQKLHTKQVGWMPTKQFKGKIAAGHVLIAEDGAGERVGYLIGNDQYFKRDDVGIIYQINVVPEVRRSLVRGEPGDRGSRARRGRAPSVAGGVNVTCGPTCMPAGER